MSHLGERLQRFRGSGAAQFTIALALLALAGATLRGVFPLADPPWQAAVGVVWHDEGAWAHNARNQVLFGAWRLDEWNPMYITPVLTGLEYAVFRAFGVGLWQARLVPEVLGVLSVLALGLGVARVGGRLAGGVAAGLLATNYVYVMFGRAAVMEGTMVGLIVVSWCCYARAHDDPVWGVPAGLFAVLAYFTKASAVFFVAAIGLDAALTIVLARLEGRRGSGERDDAARDTDEDRRRRDLGAWLTLAGVVGAAALAGAVFVLPHWHEYRFYNWQMSVTRKPAYTLRALVDRASWLPVVHDFFTRMWAVTLLALAGLLALLTRWRRVRPAERLLGSWLVLGALELMARDVGNERYLVYLIPACAGLAALVIGRDRRLVEPGVALVSRRRAWLAAPAVFFALYVGVGSIARVAVLREIGPGVRWGAAIAGGLGVLLYASWPRVPRWLAAQRWGVTAALVLGAVIVLGDVAQFAQWARIRTYKNYAAMLAIGRLLPPDTLVHGKLANGLALESRIRPVFVGRGFGNFADRTGRSDIRYLLTYTSPSLGYESQARNPVIKDVLAASPGWRILQEFDVAETPGGRDRAALIDKFPGR